MALSEEKVREYMRRLLLSRMRILCNHGFYGLLLMHMTYSIDEGTSTAYTDGERIAFSPDFLEKISDSELDYVMMHEILHVVLRHCFRGNTDDSLRYNIAADIVINSIIKQENGGNLSSITIGKHNVSMHLTPTGKEGCLYTAEEVFEMLPPSPKFPKSQSGGKSGSGENGEATDGDSSIGGYALGRAQKRQTKAKNGSDFGGIWDDHDKWGKFEEDSVMRDVWVKRFTDACEAIEIRDPSNSRGTLPAFAKRMLKKLKKPQTDWRSILNDFIQEEVNDYSFSPPDRRFEDSPFFLPDFNEKGKSDEVSDILFMIDTSGSISDAMMTAAYSEVKGAIDQFDGKLRGWLGFFDAAIIEPQPFSNFEEFIVIKPAGGGGTDFQIIFEYVDQFMQENPPVSIIIMTDGYAPFPQEKLANDIPVLWLINNDSVEPPWGKVARIQV